MLLMNSLAKNLINCVRGLSSTAHVAGFAGKNVQRGKIHTIIGLDPAGSFNHFYQVDAY